MGITLIVACHSVTKHDWYSFTHHERNVCGHWPPGQGMFAGYGLGSVQLLLSGSEITTELAGPCRSLKMVAKQGHLDSEGSTCDSSILERAMSYPDAGLLIYVSPRFHIRFKMTLMKGAQGGAKGRQARIDTIKGVSSCSDARWKDTPLDGFSCSKGQEGCEHDETLGGCGPW
jgi:hypothetical protein